jgi:O-antigen/teichoic acid export membrane protein
MTTAPASNASIQRRLIFNTLTNYASKVITLGTWFFLTPFMLRQLGASTYALWVLVGSVVAYGSLLDLGISPAVTKYVAEYQARGEVENARGLVATALWLYAALGGLAIVFSSALAPVFPNLFEIPEAQKATASWLVLLSGIGLGVALPSATATAVLRGLQRFDLVNLIGVAGMTLYAIATVVVLLLDGGLVALAAINIPITLLMQIPAIWMVYRLAPELRFGLARAQRRLLRTVYSFSAALVVRNLAGQVQTKTDEIVIAAFLPVANVTPYSIARRLSELPQILTEQFLKVLMPLASQLDAAGDQQRLRFLYLTSTRLTLALCTPLICGLLVLSGPFLATWVGPEYASAAPLVAVLALASLADTVLWPAAGILQGMARHRPMAIVAIGSALANLALSLWLVHPLGVMGVALGTLIPTTIESVFIVIPYAMRANGVGAREGLREMFWPNLAPALLMLVVMFGLREWLRPASFLSIGLIGAIGSAVYGLTYLRLSRDKPEYALVRGLAGRIVAIVKRIAGKHAAPVD